MNASIQVKLKSMTKSNEISVKPEEIQSGPKFWQAVAPVQTAGLCHPYTDLLHQNQAPCTEMPLERAVVLVQSKLLRLKGGKDFSKLGLPLTSHVLPHLVTRVVMSLTVRLTHSFTNNLSIFQWGMLM